MGWMRRVAPSTLSEARAGIGRVAMEDESVIVTAVPLQ